jgi:hypothetical protein
MNDESMIWSFELADADLSVSLEKVRTGTGERLSIRADGETLSVDALALESLTWQDDTFFTDLTNAAHKPGTITATRRSDLQVANEYTVVRLELIDTDLGPRLDLASPKLGYRCRLDTAELRALAGRDVEFFSTLLRMPYGPVDDHDHAGH